MHQDIARRFLNWRLDLCDEAVAHAQERHHNTARKADPTVAADGVDVLFRTLVAGQRRLEERLPAAVCQYIGLPGIPFMGHLLVPPRRRLDQVIRPARFVAIEIPDRRILRRFGQFWRT